MYQSTTHWIWDFWLIEHGSVWHLFHLQAPRSVHPDDRHWNATIGHATSVDLTNWERQPDALDVGPPGSPDATALWTGSVATDPAGGWLMAYTGIVRVDGVATERVLLARSDDLVTWHKDDAVVFESDPSRFEPPGATTWQHGWRDPWIRHTGDRWEMLLSARLAADDPWTAGSIVQATSLDARDWTVVGPVAGTTGVLAQLEVPHLCTIGGRTFGVICTNTDGPWPRTDPSPRHLIGTFVAPVAASGTWGPLVALDAAEQPTRYAGRIVETDNGPRYLAFHDGPGDAFPGGISDPMAVVIEADGSLQLEHLP